jgi:ectoine hydroxylase-related dioxygenase (phytanoyl-CoA dioxygenase family)
MTALRSLFDAACLAFGLIVFFISGKTPALAYQALVRLFCRTGGLSNDLLSEVMRKLDDGPRPPAPRGELGIAGADAKKVAEQLRADGYFVFPARLPDAVCDRLLGAALSTPAQIRSAQGQSAGGRARYDRAKPQAVRYDFDTADVLALDDVQELMMNPALLSVASEYLGTTPVADVVSMWWHTAHSDQPDEDAGQLYHFDMDRIQWLKFFVYLTDVNAESGPHCFIRGSHRTNGIPRELLAKGYARLSDEEVLRYYRREDLRQVVAPRGTIIAEDSRGLHKGLPVRRGDRLMLQIQFSNSLFGGWYPRARMRDVKPALSAMAKAYPKIYANYLA